MIILAAYFFFSLIRKPYFVFLPSFFHIFFLRKKIFLNKNDAATLTTIPPFLLALIFISKQEINSINLLYDRLSTFRRTEGNIFARDTDSGGWNDQGQTVSRGFFCLFYFSNIMVHSFHKFQADLMQSSRVFDNFVLIICKNVPDQSGFSQIYSTKLLIHGTKPPISLKPAERWVDYDVVYE